MKAVQGVVRTHFTTKLPGIPLTPNDDVLCDELWVEVKGYFLSVDLSREDFNTVRLECSTHNLVASPFGSKLPQ